MKPIALLIHVQDVQAGIEWYKRAFPFAQPTYIEEFDFTVLELDGFSLEIVQADSKVDAGKKGTVLYWSVPSLETSMAHFEQLGATLYRGPMVIENGFGMCQMEDPFGNLLGLRGKYETTNGTTIKQTL